MKKFYSILIALATMTLLSCGGENKTNSQAETNAEKPATTTEEASTKVEPEKQVEQTVVPEANGELSFEEFSAQMKEFCGIEPITNDKMTKIVVRRESETEFFMASPVTADIDKEGVQREYYNAFAKVADGGKMYGFHMNQTRGDDVFKDYDEYVKFIKANGNYAKAIYGYDYNGKQIYVDCAVSFGDFGLTVKLQ